MLFPYTRFIVLGILGCVFFGYLSCSILFSADQTYTQSDLEVIQGQLELVIHTHPGKGKNELQFWLKGFPLAFRSEVGYPDYYRWDVLQKLVPDVPVTVGILPSERQHPLRDWFRNGEHHINIYSLSVTNATAFSLDDYNQAEIHERKVAKIFFPALLFLSVICLAFALYKRKQWKNFLSSSA
jgi:hypothetical protein